MSKQSESFYNKFSSFYPLVDGFLRPQKNVLFKEINRLPEGNLLEIGVGNGTHFQLYKKHKIIGIDTSSAMLEIASKQNPGNVELLQMDGKALLFEDEQFDYVVLSHVIAVVDNPEQLLLIFCIGLEIFQLLNFTHGRFDLMDIWISVIFWVIGNYSFNDKSDNQNILTPLNGRTMVCFATYGKFGEIFITTLQLAFLFSVSCNTITREEKSDTGNIAAKTKIEFEHTKWHEKKDRDYPYRDAMLDDLMNSKKLKELKHKEVLDLLGSPDRTDSLYLFYMVAQKRIQGWPIYTKTLVIKLAEDSMVHWVKIHE